VSLTLFQGNTLTHPTKVVRSFAAYAATDPMEMTFSENDLVLVVQENTSGWWKGELNGAVLLFPSNYVEPDAAEVRLATASIVSCC
jgi:hypothetical protein